MAVKQRILSGLLAFGMLGAAGSAGAEQYVVKPDVGNSTLAAVFDAPLGERINAVSNEVGCQLGYDAKGQTASGSCKVPLTAIRVDNDDTKSDHFRQWATNKKMEPAQCAFEAKFAGLKLDGPLVAEKPVTFSGEVPFTVCGRGRSDGKPEHVTGTVVLLPAGSYGSAETLKIRAHIEKFNRDAYRIGPKYTDGWLARVQSLAKVVAEEGSVDLNLFAKSEGGAQAKK